jgi:hypothetical protein
MLRPPNRPIRERSSVISQPDLGENNFTDLAQTRWCTHAQKIRRTFGISPFCSIVIIIFIPVQKSKSKQFIHSIKIIMTKNVCLIGAVAALALTVSVQETQAFSPAAFVPKTSALRRFAEETKPSESAFIPVSEEEEPIELDTVEGLGRGAAKVRIPNCFYIFSRSARN